jgi:hypothetical protein
LNRQIALTHLLTAHSTACPSRKEHRVISAAAKGDKSPHVQQAVASVLTDATRRVASIVPCPVEHLDFVETVLSFAREAGMVPHTPIDPETIFDGEKLFLAAVMVTATRNSGLEGSFSNNDIRSALVWMREKVWLGTDLSQRIDLARGAIVPVFGSDDERDGSTVVTGTLILTDEEMAAAADLAEEMD